MLFKIKIHGKYTTNTQYMPPIDNFEQASQITLVCLLPALSIRFSMVFIKQIFFTFLDVLTLTFVIVLQLQQMCEILKTTAR